MSRKQIEAAYRLERLRLANAWKTSEFQNALHIAVALGQTKPMVDYLASTKPLTRGDRRMLANYIRRQLGSDSRRNALGRKPRVPSGAPAYEQAERNAAWLVATSKNDWLKKHRRKRVPSAVIAAMIRGAIEIAASEFKVPIHRIKEDNVRNALKSGRIVVP